jgi:hypothetical protein
MKSGRSRTAKLAVHLCPISLHGARTRKGTKGDERRQGMSTMKEGQALKLNTQKKIKIKKSNPKKPNP